MHITRSILYESRRRAAARPRDSFHYLLSVCLLLAFVLTACRGGASAGDGLVYERTNGFANFQDKLKLHADGRMEIQRGDQSWSLTIPAEQMTALNQMLAAAGFESLQAEYLPEDPCCDRTSYTLTFQGHSVHTLDGSVPESLQPVFDALNQLMVEATSPP